MSLLWVGNDLDHKERKPSNMVEGKPKAPPWSGFTDEDFEEEGYIGLFVETGEKNTQQFKTADELFEWWRGQE